MNEIITHNEKMRLECANAFSERVHNIFPQIIVKGEYITAKTPIECYCTNHNYTWNPRPCNLLSGFGCPKCGEEKRISKRRKPLEDIILELKEKHPNATIISDVSKILNTKSKVQMKCNICNNTWVTSLTNLLKNTNTTDCPNCARIRVAKQNTKTLSDLREEALEINQTVEPIGEYINTHTFVLCRCKIHTDTTFYQIPTTILNGSNSCPKCTTYKNEKKMLDILDKYNISYTPQKTFENCRDIRKLPFDAFLNDYNIVVEYDGEGHYIPIPRFQGDDGIMGLKRSQKHDQIKNNYCKKNNIGMIRIPYWERENMENYILENLKRYNIKIA